ncbi:hypothetical protein RhiirC2_768789 [Rhizophagus irregularis]|uniref:Uncharacterized protein n=1 Tax=Rhizophagus irregularis TaxID=588596 RepID=A0A2N1P0T0_9GLOM|nr:hypothetical protein RhiirC2_768789 [Rhizophagus irregularis]
MNLDKSSDIEEHGPVPVELDHSFAISVVASNHNKKIKDDDIFNNMIITLISFSVFCLWCTICVRICLQILIPKVTKVAEQNNKQNNVR